MHITGAAREAGASVCVKPSRSALHQLWIVRRVGASSAVSGSDAATYHVVPAIAHSLRLAANPHETLVTAALSRERSVGKPLLSMVKVRSARAKVCTAMWVVWYERERTRKTRAMGDSHPLIRPRQSQYPIIAIAYVARTRLHRQAAGGQKRR